MITKNIIRKAYDAGEVRIIDSPNGDGAVCQIGNEWFYFGGLTAEEYNAEEYIKYFPKEDIIDEIFSALSVLAGEVLLDIYSNCYCYLIQHGFFD